MPSRVGKRCLEAPFPQIGIRDNRAPSVVRCGIRICGLSDRDGLKTADADKGCGRDVCCTWEYRTFLDVIDSPFKGIASGPTISVGSKTAQF
jgi:hypothetical protein